MADSLTDRIVSQYQPAASSTPTPSAAPAPMQSKSDLVNAIMTQLSTPAPERSLNDRIQGTAAKLARGATFGLSDRLAPALLATFDYSGKPWSQSYAEELGSLKSDVSAFEQVNPYGGLLELAGGVPTILKSILAKGAATLARPILTNIGRGGLVGGVTGAAYGAGTAPEGEMASGATMGGTAGTVIGAGLPAAGSMLAAALKSQPAQAAGGFLRRAFGGEAGAVDLGDIAPAEKDRLAAAMLKRFGATPEQLTVAEQRLAEANALGVPLDLYSALGTPEALARGKTQALLPGSRNVIRSALEERQAQQASRVADIFSRELGSGETSSYAAGAQLKDAAGAILKEAKTERQKLTGPIYQKAYKEAGVIKEPRLNKLIENSPAISRAIKQAKQTSEFNRLPDTHLKVLDQAKQEMDDIIGKAGPGEQRKLIAERNKLLSIVDEISPTYQKARAAYQNVMLKDPRFREEYLDIFQNLEQDQLAAAGEKIFKLPAERIQDLKTVLGEKHEGAFTNTVRAYIQDVVDKRGDNLNVLKNKLLNTEAGRKKLTAAIGEDGFTQLKGALQFEEMMANSARLMAEGSPTAGNLVNLAREGAEGGLVDQLLTGSPKGFARRQLQKLTTPRGDIFAERMAEIAMDPNAAHQFLREKLIPLANQVAPYEAAGRAAQLGASGVAEAPTAGVLSDILARTMLGQ